MSSATKISIGAALSRAGSRRRARCSSADATAYPTRLGSSVCLIPAETLTRVTQQARPSPRALAREFAEADISREFKMNGSTNPDDVVYVGQARNGFAGWSSWLEVWWKNRSGFACRASRYAIAYPDDGTIASRAGAASENGRA